ncbi:collagen-binding domain-containing protein, partial [Cellulomonas composti]|uniref:collagen-binding domain-containing protein n=1 Tax=Cellulomonas composti TaxID=266130 RepID=UPI001649D1FB
MVAGTSSATAADALSGNPFAGAAGFTVVSYGDADVANHEIEGSIAVGGDIRSTSGQGPYNLIHKAAGNGAYALPVYDSTPVRLVVGGTFDRAHSSQLIRVSSGGFSDAATQLGRTVIGNTTGLGVAPRGSGVCVQADGDSSCSGAVIEQSVAPQTVGWTTQAGAFDALVPSAARDTMLDWSAGLASGDIVGAATATFGGDFGNPMNGLEIGMTANATNVLDVAASAFPSGDWKLKFPGVVPSPTSPLVINVTVPDGGNLNFPMEAINQYSGGSDNNLFARYVVWNIVQPAGSSVYLSGNGIVPGSILAPNSHVVTGFSGPADTSVDKVLVEGQVVAASIEFKHSGEVHHYGFAADITIAGGGDEDGGGFS